MVDAEILRMREEIARRNIELIQQLHTLGKAPAPWLPIQVTCELLIDLIFETDDERERFGIQIEKLLGEKLQAALEQAQKPQLLVPPT